MKQKRSKLLQFVWGNITMALDYLWKCTFNGLTLLVWCQGGCPVCTTLMLSRVVLETL